MQYISTMVSTLSQTTPVGPVKKQKKETINNIGLNMEQPRPVSTCENLQSEGLWKLKS